MISWFRNLLSHASCAATCSLHLFTPLLMTFGPSGNLRGFLRGLPSMLFRTQARRVMFMLASAVLLCLVIPSTLAIVRESLPAFIASVCSLTVGLALPGGIRLVTWMDHTSGLSSIWCFDWTASKRGSPTWRW